MSRSLARKKKRNRRGKEEEKRKRWIGRKRVDSPTHTRRKRVLRRSPRRSSTIVYNLAQFRDVPSPFPLPPSRRSALSRFTFASRSALSRGGNEPKLVRSEAIRSFYTRDAPPCVVDVSQRTNILMIVKFPRASSRRESRSRNVANGFSATRSSTRVFSRYASSRVRRLLDVRIRMDL